MSDEELLEKLLQFSDVLTTNNIFTSGLRIIGWGLLLFLKTIVDSLEGMMDGVLTLTDFFMSEPVHAFLETIQPVLYILLALSLAMIGFRIIFNKEKNRAEIPMNIFIAVMTISLLTFGMGQVNEFTGNAVEVAQVDNDSMTTSDQVITDYITDIAIYDETGWETPDVETQHHVSPDNIDKISINETITREFEKANGEQLSSVGKEIVINKVGLESNGEEGLVEIGKSSLFDFLPEHYYRWHVDWFTAMVTLGVMAFTMVLVSIKVAKLCFELGFNHIVALIMAYADISTGQRLKAIIKNIGSIFVSLVMIFLSLRVYMYYTTFIGENLEGMAYLIALVAGSLAVIDGPNIVEKLFGIDAGLKNAWGVAMGGYLASKTLGPPAKKAAGAMASGGTSAVMNTGAGAAGAVTGLAAGKAKGPSQENAQQTESTSPTQPAAKGPGQGAGQKNEPSPMQPSNGKEQARQENPQAAQPGAVHSLSQKPVQTDSASGGSTSSVHKEMQEEARKRQSSAPTSQANTSDDVEQASPTTSQSKAAAANSTETNKSVENRTNVTSYARKNEKDTQSPTEEPNQEAPSASSNLIPSQADQSHVPTGTDDIGMLNQNRTEQRTVGQYMKDRTMDHVRRNRKIQGAKRTYDLTRNTTENWKGKVTKRGRGS